MFYCTWRWATDKSSKEISGEDEKLIRYDTLRIKFKGLQQNKETKTERTEYESLLTEIHSRILSIKQTTRNELKMVEKQYMTYHTTTTLHTRISTINLSLQRRCFVYGQLLMFS